MEAEQLWATSRQTSLRMLAYEGPEQPCPSVVVLHGLTTGIDVLRGSVPGLDPYALLAAEGCNVLAVDWPGHGRSGGTRGHLTYRLAMEAAATAVTTAAARWESPVGLFGTALGGVLAFYAALEDDRVGAVACHNVLDLRDVRPALQRARQRILFPIAARAAAVLPELAQRRIRLPAGAVVAPGNLCADPALSRSIRRHPQAVGSYDLASLGSILLSPADKPDISAQRAPTLVAVGSADRVLPETSARAFLAQLTCPTQLWVLPGGGHQLLLEHPRALLPTVAGFLRDQLAADPAQS